MRIQVSTQADRSVVENFYQFYHHDLSVYTGAKPDDSGLFPQSQYLSRYWEEDNRYAILALNDEGPIGFSLIKEVNAGYWSLDEFFVAKPFRRSGYGKKFASMIFDAYPGTWEVSQIDENKPAIDFWLSVIDEYTGSQFTNSRSADQPVGPKQIFNSLRL